MPWIRITFGRFGFGIFRGFPPALMIGWLYIQWLGFGYFQKQNKALAMAEREIERQDLYGND